MTVFDGKTEIKTIHNGNVTVKIVTESLWYLHNKFNDIYHNFPYEITVKGVAKCSPNDEYDEKIGDGIALKRAFLKLEDKKMKILEKIENEIEKKKRECTKYIRIGNSSFMRLADQLYTLAYDKK